MFKIWHHFGDWEMETKHMTRIEKSIYFDMRTLYLNQGKALTDDLALLQRRLSCHSDEEKQALDFVLLDKFKHCKKSKTYKHQEWDLILKNYRWKHRNVSNAPSNASNETGNAQVTDGNGDSNGMSNAERQAIFKQKRLEMIQALRNMGVEVANNIKMAELKPLYEQHFNDIGNAPSNASNEQVTDGNDEVTTDNEKNRANNQEPITKEPVTINQDIHISTPHGQTGEQVDDVQELLKLWTIPLKQVNDFIQMSALQPMTESEFNQLKPAFVGYYADDIRNGISSGKILSKLVSWLKREKLDNDIRQAKYAKKLTTATPNVVNQNHDQRNVNAMWSEPNIQPLDLNQSVTIPEGWD